MAHLSGVYLLICALIAIIPGNVADYCKVESCGATHTMCKYKPGPAENCKQVLRRGLTSAERDEILHKHNELREKVASGNEKRGAPGPQPASSNLGPLKWDTELAKVAQRWADQCRFGHDQCRNDDRFSVGQNVASTSKTGQVSNNFGKLVENWYNEVADFNMNQVSRFTTLYDSGKVVGHYTQLVWANSKYVGCGSMRYKDGGWSTTYLVCNYGPAGNVLGQEVYKIR